ncbi:phage conserved hypothetical protein, phiE125 gp8 family [Poseidonocella pacifica]|uniref:Phage gp6-like head-tail connector protein n=1 Tax=Poseidonocella pacifica TaxID=871651 RepID=A0A1I0VPJ1_9RHOB|nr:head-tail connector protein [Poseidonocella pacifica]SFA78128.1 phage conserved hypothetical protein, phiE125 gp8 family [Poseidonocella pacifica]
MMLVEETTIPAEALPVEAFKNHLRLGTGFAEDAVQDPVLESFLRAAIAAIEARTGKVLIERDFSWSLSAWRDAGAQALPVAPVSAITEFIIHDRLGEVVVIEADRYWLERDIQRPRVRPTGAVLPSIPPGGSAEIVFTAGYGVEWSTIPADLGQAVMLLASHYYEYREERALSGGCMPFGVASLIERYRTVRLFVGGGVA